MIDRTTRGRLYLLARYHDEGMTDDARRTIVLALSDYLEEEGACNEAERLRCGEWALIWAEDGLRVVDRVESFSVSKFDVVMRPHSALIV